MTLFDIQTSIWNIDSKLVEKIQMMIEHNSFLKSNNLKQNLNLYTSSDCFGPLKGFSIDQQHFYSSTPGLWRWT